MNSHASTRSRASAPTSGRRWTLPRTAIASPRNATARVLPATCRCSAPRPRCSAPAARTCRSTPTWRSPASTCCSSSAAASIPVRYRFTTCPSVPMSTPNPVASHAARPTHGRRRLGLTAAGPGRAAGRGRLRVLLVRLRALLRGHRRCVRQWRCGADQQPGTRYGAGRARRRYAAGGRGYPAGGSRSGRCRRSPWATPRRNLPAACARCAGCLRRCAQLQAQIDQRESALATAESDLKRRQGLLDDGAISGEELSHARDNVTRLRAARGSGAPAARADRGPDAGHAHRQPSAGAGRGGGGAQCGTGAAPDAAGGPGGRRRRQAQRPGWPADCGRHAAAGGGAAG